MPGDPEDRTDAPLVIAFDTSSAHVTGAVLQGETVLAQAHEEMAKGQAERLMGFCQELLDTAGLRIEDIDLVATGTGPGNFTGIRISVSAARGLALGLGIPAIGVSILEAQAFGLTGPVISTLDGRRETIYLQMLQTDVPIAPMLCDLDTLPELPDGISPACVGFRSGDVAERLSGRSTASRFPVAEAIGRCAMKRLHLDNPRPAPLYIRPADAAPARDTAPVILT
ncbi:tRNA (adenosine(37)-N6)-threonylcarbamoyltransferase complex dimerization subunit type 1 TsaB [Roseobacter sp. S98]|uniref:tRNA (adenosine(37)-N6)-threonylcarbamoyltransferase complex dimerization subunit type 1 TsaB n=1 Tax=Roseobacter algicola (ex Choi et al. 2025) (nom. illeg.) TaxID=3092138 RepID=UPI003F514FD3